MTTHCSARTRRIYDDPSPEDGARVLVDRLWPRGVSKTKAQLDEWRKDIAPSTELRHWYGHAPELFEEFARRYRAELARPDRAEALTHLCELARRRTLTLLTATKEIDISGAVVLSELINSSNSMPRPVAADVPGRREVILALLNDSIEPRSIASLAQELEVHPNTVRFHLETLVQAGRVEQTRGTSSGTGRPPNVFRASRTMDPAGPTSYRMLATALTGYLAEASDDPATTAKELGRSVGASFIRQRRAGRTRTRSQSVAQLVQVLDELGFKPETPPARAASEIRLRHCPFHDVAQKYGEVTCSIHLGLMQGVLSELRGPVTVDSLRPFVEPDLCVAHLE